MKKIMPTIALAAALTLPCLAQARPLKLTTTLTNYGGDGAYLAYYVTDAQGKYVGSLWMAGGKAKYYDHLSGWTRATGGNTGEVNGITGASVGAGRSLKVTVDLADALIDAGYQIRVDSSVEKNADRPAEVVAPLTANGRRQAVAGRGFVQSLQYDF